MDIKSENSQFGAMSVDLNGNPLDIGLQSLGDWLQRAPGQRPSAVTPVPKPTANNALSPPATPSSLAGLNHSATPETMIPAQLAVKMERMINRINESERQIYILQDKVDELQSKKMQLNEEIAGLSNAKSAIKTINQRLNTIQFGFSRILDRVEVLEKTAGIGDAVRSTNNTHRNGNGASMEFIGGGDGAALGDGSINIPGNPLNVLTLGPTRRGRNKHKRRAVDQGDRSTVTAPVPTFNTMEASNPAAGSSDTPDEIAKMEELLAMVVKKLAAMKMANLGGVDVDDGSATTSAAVSSSVSATDGDVSMETGNYEAGVQTQGEQMVEEL